MSRIVENLIKNLKTAKFGNLDNRLLTEFSEHYELNNPINISFVEIDGEEGVLVLDKALSYEIFFINSNSFEFSKLYWTLEETDALGKYNEMKDCCK